MQSILVAQFFSSPVRLRGHEYFRSKRVHVLKWEDDFANFLVKGTQDYSIKLQIDLDRRRLFGTCTCPYFAEGLACKHLWAVMLRAESMNIFPETDSFEDLTLSLKPKTTSAPTIKPEKSVPEVADWRKKFRSVTERVSLNVKKRTLETRAKNLSLAIDLERSTARDTLIVHLLTQERLKNDEWGAIKPRPLTHLDIPAFTDPQDQNILWNMLGRGRQNPDEHGGQRGTTSIAFEDPSAKTALLSMAQRNKLFLIPRQNHYYHTSPASMSRPFNYKDELWHLRLSVTADLEKKNQFGLSIELTCGLQTRPLQDITHQAGEFIFFADYLARAAFLSDDPWRKILATNTISSQKLSIPESDINEFLEMYFATPSAPEIILPPSLEFTEIQLRPPQVRVIIDQVAVLTHVSMRIEFNYDSKIIAADDPRPVFYNLTDRQKALRHVEFEAQAKDVYERHYTDDRTFDEETLIKTIEAFIALGWEVLVAHKPIQPVTPPKVEVTSGIDWFDVDVQLPVNNQNIMLPQLLQNITSQQRLLILDDGSVGILPQKWLQKLSALTELGITSGNQIRINKVQGLFISEIFADDKNFKTDKKFKALQNLITELGAAELQKPDSAFKGDLRAYQQAGLAWLSALTKHNIGGILADDMGLGKTVQVLALLSKVLKKKQAPALIVAPKTLVFNWIKEAEKFCPHLKVLNYSGNDRDKLQEQIDDHHLIVTTYQTLRNDIEKLQQTKFSYFILDEAHYVKNATTQNSIACRLVQAETKFALSGTPVENSLTDLFSIFSIINPGLITKTMLNRWGRERDPEKLKTLALAFKPFLLRRTKDQVLEDLPEKSEQILYCELSPDEQKNYDDLKHYYWQKVSGQIESKGLARSKFEILEGLLRLRQAACHPGLLNPKLKDKASTKFELLLEQIDTVVRDGHKALIFSQFTSLLSLLKTHLTAKNISFEYLDGKTKHRQECVERFQNTPEISLFLLSLKAGGVGLNLTAADYVFILDPWWNPAAEMQAIDRAHRIGQKKKVFAYKIIAKNTVEEKILELQNSKKQLARAVIGDESSMLKGLKLSDLQNIFS